MENLLGPTPDPALLDEMSSDLKVTSETPPTFLMHTAEDAAVPAENSLLFYKAMRKAHVPGELHLYQEGPHGAGLANGRHGAYWVPSLLSWSIDAERWLREYWLPECPGIALAGDPVYYEEICVLEEAGSGPLSPRRARNSSSRAIRSSAESPMRVAAS